jgi:hypothetical protein
MRELEARNKAEAVMSSSGIRRGLTRGICPLSTGKEMRSWQTWRHVLFEMEQKYVNFAF